MNDVDNTSNENVYSTLEVAPINSTELDEVTEASNTQTEESINTVDGFDEEEVDEDELKHDKLVGKVIV